MSISVSSSSLWLQASPEFKGIKTYPLYVNVKPRGFKPALNSKGLRRVLSAVSVMVLLQASPEFKGIKTNVGTHNPRFALLQASPEFKGIKTH